MWNEAVVIYFNVLSQNMAGSKNKDAPVPKHHTTKVYIVMQLKIHAFLTKALDAVSDQL
jgi:hypothetical protein